MKALLCTIPLDIGIPRSRGEAPTYPKIAMVSLIKWMEKNGFTREEYDFFDIDMLDSSDEDIRKFFEESKPDVFGLSAVVSTAYFQVRRIAKIAREVCPNAWIVMGGSLSAAANVVLRKTEVDLCIQSDGENPWVQFLQYVKTNNREWKFDELRKIRGLTFINGESELEFTEYPLKIPASENPFPDYDLLKIGIRTQPEAFSNYFRPGKDSSWFKPDPRSQESHRRPQMASLWTTKGCVARCTFCQRSTKGYGTNNVTTLDEHLQILKEKYNVGFIHILDENFGSDKEHAKEVAATMKKHDMLWICSGVRCSSVDFEIIKNYQDSGCTGLKFGVESGSQIILDVMEKRFTVDQVYTALRHCYQLGVYSPLAVMVGMPGETNDTATETGKYLGKVARMIGTPPGQLGISVFYALPLPGTPFYQFGQQNGVIGREVDDEERYLLAFSDLGAEKDNYINLNGASMRDVLFWDFLVRYEATRTYFEKPLGDDKVTHHLNVALKVGELPEGIHGVEHSDENMEVAKLYPSLGSLTKTSLQATHHLLKDFKKLTNPKFLMWWIRLQMTYPMSIVNYKLVNKVWVSKIPRPILYGVLKNALYLEYLYRKAVRAMLRKMGHPVRERNLYNDYKLLKPLDPVKLRQNEQRIDRSLRAVVKMNREESFKPGSLTEANQEILQMGR